MKQLIPGIPEAMPVGRVAQLEYLGKHFRYHTMNCWNQATSYANRIKVRTLNLTPSEQEACYDMLEVDEAWADFRHILASFDAQHDYCWQIGTNGRSGGYLVLYRGAKKPSGVRSICRHCGQVNCREVPKGKEPGRCGACHDDARYNVTETHYHVVSYPGQDVDMYAEYDHWDDEMLAQRTELVWAFDRTCEDACRAFFTFATSHTAVDETVFVAKTVRIAVPGVR